MKSQAREEAKGEDKPLGWFAEGPLRRLLSNASLLVGGRSLNGIFNLCAMTLVVRSVGLETFGMLALIHAVMKTASDLAKFQSWQAVLRYGTPALEEGRTLDFRRLVKLTTLLDLASGVFGVAAACIAVPMLAARFGWSTDSVLMIQAYALSILFMVTATPTGLLRLFDRFDLLSISNAIGSFIRVLGALWVFALGGGLEFLLATWFIATVASGLWLIGHSIRMLATKGLLTGPRLGYRNLGEGHAGLTAFVWTTQTNTTLAAGTKHMATVVVGFFLSPASAGVYDIAKKVTALLTRSAKLMKPAIYPEFARLSARDDVKGIRQLMLRSMALMLGAAIVLVTPFVLFGRPLLGFAFGVELEAAHGLVVLLAIAAAIRLLSFPLEPALISTGRAGSALVVRAATFVGFLATLFILLPRIGLIGAGIAGVVASLTLFLGQAVAVVAWMRRFSSAQRAG